MTTIRPLGEYLVLRPGKKPGMAGDLHLPDTEMLRDSTGGWCEVLAAGRDCLVVRAGDRVHVKAYGSHYAGIELEVRGDPTLMIKERDITGVDMRGHVIPIGDRVLMKRDETEQKAGKLFLPEDRMEKAFVTCIVTSVGCGRKLKDGKLNVDLGVEVGDKVHVPKHAYSEVTIDGVKFLLINSDQIQGVVP